MKDGALCALNVANTSIDVRTNDPSKNTRMEEAPTLMSMKGMKMVHESSSSFSVLFCLGL